MSLPAPPVTWKKTDPLTAEKLQRMVRESIRGINVGPGLRVTTTPDGWVTVGLLEKTYPIIRPVELIRITSNYSGGGKYHAIMVKPPTADVDTSSDDIDRATFDSPDIIAINTREEGKATHDISTDNAFKPQLFLAMYWKTNEDGTLVYVFDGYQWEDCVPAE